MKKLSIICAALMSLGFVACDDTSDLGKMQTNQQETVMQAGGIEVFYLPEMSGQTLNLEDLKGTDIPVLGFTTAADPETGDQFILPETAKVSFVLEMASDENFSNKTSVDLTEGEDGKYFIAADAMYDAYAKLFGKAPNPNTTYFRVIGYMSDNGQLVRFGSPDTYFAGTSKVVTPIDLNLNIETEYYFASSLTGMSLTDGTLMSHSDSHVYDDPNFSFLITVTDTDVANDPVTWYIIPGSQHNAQGSKDLCWGVDAENAAATSGALVLGGVAGEITAPGNYQILVNMEKGTYRIGYTNENLYVWGAGTKYKFDTAMPLFTDDYSYYTGMAYVKTDFALFGEKSTKGLHLGATASTEPGNLVSGSTAQTIKVEDEGYYWFNVNLTSMTYKMFLINTIGVCGINNGWGATEDAALTPNADHTVWTGDVNFDSAGEYKFRANNAWEASWGNQLDNLGFDSQTNLKVAEAGTYSVRLDFSSYPFTATVTKK